MRVKGNLIKWEDDKGFGFIKPIGQGKEVFVHINNFQTKSKRPVLNQLVTFTLSKDQQGRTCAKNATHAGERLLSSNKKPLKSKSLDKNNYRKRFSFSLLFAYLYLVLVGYLVINKVASFHFLSGYLLLSLVTIIAYGWDKRAAQKDNWRTPESTLQFLALIGGWPGAIWAQQKLRHKSKKLSFRIQLWLMIVFNVSAFVWFFVPSANSYIKSWL